MNRAFGCQAHQNSTSTIGNIPFGGLAIMVTDVTLDPWLCVAGFHRLCLSLYSAFSLSHFGPQSLYSFVRRYGRRDLPEGGSQPDKIARVPKWIDTYTLSTPSLRPVGPVQCRQVQEEQVGQAWSLTVFGKIQLRLIENPPCTESIWNNCRRIPAVVLSGKSFAISSRNRLWASWLVCRSASP